MPKGFESAAPEVKIFSLVPEWNQNRNRGVPRIVVGGRQVHLARVTAILDSFSLTISCLFLSSCIFLGRRLCFFVFGITSNTLHKGSAAGYGLAGGRRQCSHSSASRAATGDIPRIAIWLAGGSRGEDACAISSAAICRGTRRITCDCLDIRHHLSRYGSWITNAVPTCTAQIYSYRLSPQHGPCTMDMRRRLAYDRKKFDLLATRQKQKLPPSPCSNPPCGRRT